jgi:glycosyltransferase involved in cell wall biosynthesis
VNRASVEFLRVISKPRYFFFPYPENVLKKCVANEKKHGDLFVAAFHQPAAWLSENYNKDSQHMRCIDTAIALGPSQVSAIRSLYGIQDVVVVPHGVNSELFFPNEADAQVDSFSRNGEFNILVVGGWMRDIELLRSVIVAALGGSRNWRFTLIGSDVFGELSQKYSNCVYLRNVSLGDLLAIYRRADVAFLPLLDAVANNSLLEALVSGIPTVVTDVGDVKFYATGSGAISLIELNTDSAFFALSQIERELGEGRARRDLNSARLMAGRYDWPCVASRLSEVIFSKISAMP